MIRQVPPNGTEPPKSEDDIQREELGPRGVRVAWLLSPGSPDPNESDLLETKPGNRGPLLGRLPTYDDIANAAVFSSSDWAPLSAA